MFESPLLGLAATDAHTAALLSDRAVIDAWLAVEIAWAEAQAGLGLIPIEAASAIAAALPRLTVAPAQLAAGCERDGVAIPALVTWLREALPPVAADWLHFGATSQDIIDTGLALRLRGLCALQRRQLQAVGAALAALAQAHRDTPVAARTRFQQAVPTSFGLKAAQWLAPLSRQLQRLEQLQPRLLVVQCGGAAGNLAALGERGAALPAALARQLGLGAPALPWHAQRETLAEYAGWLAATTGCLGKLGQDLLLLAQSEIAEVRWRDAGGSSTMPQKHNPVAAETLVALARYGAQQPGAVQQALLHAHERDGAAWACEGLALQTQLAVAGAALRCAVRCLAQLQPDPARMRANLDTGAGAALAEAVVFELAAQFGPAAARALFTEISAEISTEISAAAGATPLAEALTARCPVDANRRPRDWHHFLTDYPRHFGSAGAFIDAALAEWRALAADR